MLKTLDLAFSEDLLQIFTSISEAFNMRMSVLDLNMNEIAPMQIQPICTYCNLVQNRLGLLNLCKENDAKYCTMATEKKVPVSYTCHAGLREAVFPIIIDGDPIGFFIIGQFKTTETIAPSILAESKNKMVHEQLEKAYSSITTHQEERLESILKLIEITTEYAIEKKLVSIKRNLLTDQIHKFIMHDLKNNPSAQEAAEAVHKSTSSINKTLKQVVGLSFRKYSNKLRLDKAKELLEEYPELTVFEVANKVGIQDPFYFSRLFKKEFSMSPSKIRETKNNR
jgi:AraC-like DNA-binding protein